MIDGFVGIVCLLHVVLQQLGWCPRLLSNGDVVARDSGVVLLSILLQLCHQMLVVCTYYSLIALVRTVDECGVIGLRLCVCGLLRLLCPCESTLS